MNMSTFLWTRTLVASAALLVALPAFAQFGGRFGGDMMNREARLIETWDRDNDGRLNAAERKAVREAASKGSSGRPGRNWPPDLSGPPSSPRNSTLSPVNVKSYASEALYDPKVLRTLFLTFENKDWEDELAFFYNTDVEVPAQVVVDGKTYDNVGVHFRGMTSFRMIGSGQKRSLNLSFDEVDPKQRLLGYQTLNLLNSAADPTFLRAMLYMQIARDYIPAPKSNYMRVVINGENWGVYVSLQQFNSEFTREAGHGSGERWKVPGSPRSRGGGLSWLGDDPQQYKRYYEIRSKDKPESWAKLVNLARVLNQTPIPNLVAALEPILDIDGVLRFLAIEKVLINNDGYWTRGSDYSLYVDKQDRFHVVPHDVNEAMRPIENLGWGRFESDANREGDAVDLDLFAGSDDPSKPLLNRLMQVPELRAKYLGYVRDINDKWLTWERLGPLAGSYQSLIAPDVRADFRKLGSTEEFTEGVTVDRPESFGGPVTTPGLSLKSFVEKRHAYIAAALETYDRGRRSATSQ
jgi:CotH kinase protein